MKFYSFTPDKQNEIFVFLCETHEELSRPLKLNNRDKDFIDIKQSYLGNRQGFWYYLNSEDKVIATVGLRKQVDSRNLEYAEIRRLYVAHEYRGEKIGSGLFTFVADYAQDNGYMILRGTTSRKQKVMIQMVKNYGCIEIPKYRDSEADFFFERKLHNDI